MKRSISLAASLLVFGGQEVHSFVVPTVDLSTTRYSAVEELPPCLKMAQSPPEGPAGSFFHRIPDDSKKDGEGDEVDSNSMKSSNDDIESNDPIPEFDIALSKLLEQRRRPPRASRPSTINGIPTEKAAGFGKLPPKSVPKSSSKPYVALGPSDSVIYSPPINDPTKPEFDDQGYTLYTDRETGKKSRVFEALVDYPCTFTLKIVGANEGDFVRDMLAVVAEACDATVEDISHSTKAVGKWTSVTVQAPVENSEMLYTLYEKVDLDPRVKFKF